MIKYEDYLDKCFELSSSKEASSFIRSQFDYGTRQRRGIRGYTTYNVILTLTFGELNRFKTFWNDLNLGTDIFLTDMVIHDDVTYDKQVRFSDSYTLNEWDSSGIWVLQCPLEIVRTGIPRWERCPLIPSNFLLPNDEIKPC